MNAWALVLSLAALLAGGALGALWQRSRARSELRLKESEMRLKESELTEAQTQLREHKAADQARSQSLQDANEKFQAQLKALASEALSRSQKDFLNLAEQAFENAQTKSSADLKQRQQAIESLVKPIRESLEQTRKTLGEMENKRAEAQGELREQIQAMNSGNEQLRSTTHSLVTALRRPEIRGQWGEMQLRRLVEIAGLQEHCDFVEQPQGAQDKQGKMRPDMIVKLPEGGQLVVDAKTPLDAYLRAVEATGETERAELLDRHADNVEAQIRRLASKQYWDQFERSPDFVVMFLPGDHFLAAAGDKRPDLMERALRECVILATPTSMMALLRVTAYGWRQLALAENAQEISDLAATLLERVVTFSGHFGRLGAQLNTAVKTYNSATGSFQSRLIPALERMKSAGVRQAGKIKVPEDITTTASSRLPHDADEEAEPPAPAENR